MVERVTPFVPPPDYNRIKVVHSFDELVTTSFADGINALCWQRSLPGDFREVADRLEVGEGIVTLDELCLENLRLSEAGKVAREILLADQRLLRGFDLLPSLDCVHGSALEVTVEPIQTHVSSFHVDSATVAADTYLCTYAGATSEGLRNDQARRRVDIPEIRAELLRLFGGPDGEEFLTFLNENCYDLHYAPLPYTRPFSFGLGNLWRLAIEYPGCPVPPCIHRAPLTLPGDSARLLLIS